MTDLRSALRSEIALRTRLAEAVPLCAGAHSVLLDLALCRIEGRRTSISGVCYGAGVRLTTGLRHIALLVDAGLIQREADPDDGRRVWLSITDEGFARVSAVFEPPAMVRAA